MHFLDFAVINQPVQKLARFGGINSPPYTKVFMSTDNIISISEISQYLYPGCISDAWPFSYNSHNGSLVYILRPEQGSLNHDEYIALCLDLAIRYCILQANLRTYKEHPRSELRAIVNGCLTNYVKVALKGRVFPWDEDVYVAHEIKLVSDEDYGIYGNRRNFISHILDILSPLPVSKKTKTAIKSKSDIQTRTQDRSQKEKIRDPARIR